jgi:hypothetical protein
MSYAYRIPAEFVAKHREALEKWDWSKPFPLLKVVKDCGFYREDTLELRDGKVRSSQPGTAKRMRLYAETLPQQPKPTPEEIAEVLKHRNPVSQS